MTMITGDTKHLGLIGSNAHYTLSPAIHNHASRALRLDFCYQYFDVPGQVLEKFLDVAWQVGFQGLNVTQPHKLAVAGLVQSDRLKSVNTLVRGADGWIGYSTDGEGFDRGLDRIGHKLSDFSTLLILGTGGASRAIVEYAFDKNKTLKKIIIMRRNGDKDSAIRPAVPSGVSIIFLDWNSKMYCSAIQEHNAEDFLVVQATNLRGSASAFDGFSEGMVGFYGVFVDLIYDQPSSLYLDAIAKNLKCLDGLPMLIEQARLSQLVWWGKAASYEELAYAIKNTGVFHR